MTLSLTAPKIWKAVSNEKETRYEDVLVRGKRVLERFNTEWFLGFYENLDEVAAYQFD